MNYYKTIEAYCRAISIPPPKHPLFDIRSFGENMPTVVHQMPPFRHAFYAIAIKIEGKGKAVSSHYTHFPNGSVVFFNSPFQILSWDIAPDWEGYYIMMSQEFLGRSNAFDNFLEQFPFLKIGEAIPFAINKKEERDILEIFTKIHTEYHSTNTDKFEFINTYVLLLLHYVKRYFRLQVNHEEANTVIRSADIKLMSRYQALIELHFGPDRELGKNVHSPSFYAALLNVHPNHLNAVVKGISGKTALQHIHAHMVHLAKSYLSQTNLSIKEIAYQLQFDAPTNFSTLFKKYTRTTPGTYRKKAHL
ncbi:MAG: helix-turn-helix domain-containing protein [Flavobacteriaceae bacterium]